MSSQITVATYASCPSHTHQHICTTCGKLAHVCAPISLLHTKKSCIPHHPVINQSIWRPHIPAMDHFIHWLSPFSLTNMNILVQHLPIEIIAREHLIIVCAVNSKMLSNYSASLLRFAQFYDQFLLTEDLCMPHQNGFYPISLLHCSAGSVGGGAMK